MLCVSIQRLYGDCTETALRLHSEVIRGELASHRRQSVKAALVKMPVGRLIRPKPPADL